MANNLLVDDKLLKEMINPKEFRSNGKKIIATTTKTRRIPFRENSGAMLYARKGRKTTEHIEKTRLDITNIKLDAAA